MPIDVQAIINHGWQQGSLFTPGASRTLLAERYSQGARLILASQDCDIVHRGKGEPYADAFVATPIRKIAATEAKARNARRLHIPLTIAQALHAHEILFWSRTVLSREKLSEFAPDVAAKLAAGHLKWFQHWLGSRYDRPALPDAFNSRLETRDARRAIRAILEPCEHCVQDIYLQIDPYNIELDESVPYAVRVALIMSSIDAGRVEMVEAAQRGGRELEAFLRACPGVEVGDVEIMTDTDFTLADLDSYRPWDYTDLSLPDGE